MCDWAGYAQHYLDVVISISSFQQIATQTGPKTGCAMDVYTPPGLRKSEGFREACVVGRGRRREWRAGSVNQSEVPSN